MKQPKIELKNVFVHNLKNVYLDLNPNQLIVFTGVSGSGKTSLAFDTIYAEGQRRYVESLSTYARRFMGPIPKPDADDIRGISPTIAIEQKQGSRSPRSTVGTLTGIYDLLRVLFAKIATPYCPISGKPVASQSIEEIKRHVFERFDGKKVMILAPVIKNKKGDFKEELSDFLKKGFTRVFIDNKLYTLSDIPDLEKNAQHSIDIVMDRILVSKKEESRILESVTKALELGTGLVEIFDTETELRHLFSTFHFSKESGQSYEPLDPLDFSFNHPKGMCEECDGLGICLEFDETKIIDPKKSISEDCCSIAGSYSTVRWKNIYDNLARIYRFKVTTPWKDLSDNAKNVLLHGTEEKWIKMVFTHPTKKNSWTDFVHYQGIIPEAKERLSQAKSESYQKKIRSLMAESICPQCHGHRIKAFPAAARFHEKTIGELCDLPIDELYAFFSSLNLPMQEEKIGEELIKEVMSCLKFLLDVGLGYLSLSRVSPTLSGGELQRVRLASQIGSGLVGTTYVLDEPSIGLHDRDQKKLIDALLALRDLGNTVIVVEHDEATMRAADYIVDIGPGAGVEGGHIVAKGSYEEIVNTPHSLTGQYLSKIKKIEIPKKRRKTKEFIQLLGATHHNLQNVDVKIPLGVFTAITGVSGSGKSSLVIDTLYPLLSNHLHKSELKVGAYKKVEGIEHLDKVIEIDQSPIGKTSRSNPATYTKLFDDIRDLFSELPAAKAFGYKAGQFSFNVKEGSCPQCQGMGFIKIDMDFLEDETVTCPECDGKRFDRQTLSIEYKGRNIFDILELSVDESALFFEDHPAIYRKLSLLQNVGLGYMKIGQPSTTLSGGEAQRIKLAKELSRPSTGRTLYILDEPTTGLHFEDIRKLIQILQKLVDEKNSVIVIEHNLEMVKCADWVIDLGPEGGRGGGRILAEGTPEQILKKNTATSHCLKDVFEEVPAPHNPKKLFDPLAEIVVEEAEQNNLQKVSASIPRGKITVCTGPSGSGKTSFSLDTLYAEGQRRFVESLSPYARQFIQTMDKPIVKKIEGLSPAIAIEQKKHAGNPRSTVGTLTETYDYFRILFAKEGVAYCPETGEPIVSITPEYILGRLKKYPEGTKMQILSELKCKSSDEFNTLKDRLLKEGYIRIRLNKEYYQLEESIPFESRMKNELFLVIDRLILKKGIEKRLLDAIEKASFLSHKKVTIALEDRDLSFNLAFCVEKTGKSYPSITPQLFSFNSDEGMCRNCLGLGFVYGVSFEDSSLLEMTPFDLLGLLLKEYSSELSYHFFFKIFAKLGIDPHEPLNLLNKEAMNAFFHGSPSYILYDEDTQLYWKGLASFLEEWVKSASSRTKNLLSPLLSEHTCPECSGARLNPLARNVLYRGHSLPALCQKPIEELFSFMQESKSASSKAIEEILTHIQSKLSFVLQIGLGYLSLDRSAPTLSNGESQRIHLARQLGSSLTGCLYVIDEPTIGLHPHDNHLLNDALIGLKNLGNTLVLVEHDPMTIQIADKILDFGPAAGVHGGHIVAEGTVDEIKKNPRSLTGKYLRKESLPQRKILSCKDCDSCKVEHIQFRNLSDINVEFPQGRLTTITGVSGCGKSSLLIDVIEKGARLLSRQRDKKPIFTTDYGRFENFDVFDDVSLIDQNPIGHTARSDISTYIDLLTPLRGFFAALPEASIRGLMPKHFSFNHLQGMCRTCFGLGYKMIDLQFLPSVKITCPDCLGYRLNPLALKVPYKGRHLGQVLDVTVNEAFKVLPPIPKVEKIIAKMEEIGLGYLKLNQQVATLSCGEAQRLRLARELMKRSSKKILYILDEPTTGLHNEDIIKLVPILSKLVDKGHTVIMIEHNVDMILLSDYVIDMGPKAGPEGGKILYSGDVKGLLQQKKSLTGKYCKDYLTG